MFIIGVRYGTKVEQANKTIPYLQKLSLTPVNPTPTIQYLTYKLEGCKVQFTYPSYLVKSYEKPRGISLDNSQKQTILTLNCSPELAVAEPETEKITTEEIKLKNKKTTATIPKEGFLRFIIQHPQKRTITIVTIHKSLYSLFESSFQFQP